MKKRNEAGLTYEIQTVGAKGEVTAILKFNGFDCATITSTSKDGIHSQFETILSLIEDHGAMLRHGIILLGYHNDDLSGDVLLADGELLGSWYMDEIEICYFTVDGKSEVEISAPSAWLMHDAIFSWLNRKTEAETHES